MLRYSVVQGYAYSAEYEYRHAQAKSVPSLGVWFKLPTSAPSNTYLSFMSMLSLPMSSSNDDSAVTTAPYITPGDHLTINPTPDVMFQHSYSARAVKLPTILPFGYIAARVKLEPKLDNPVVPDVQTCFGPTAGESGRMRPLQVTDFTTTEDSIAFFNTLPKKGLTYE
jgi:hypothetical protein